MNQAFKVGQRLYTKKEVADMFRTCVRTVERWVESGELKGIRTAGTGSERATIVFTEAQVEAFAEARRMMNSLFSTANGFDDFDREELDPAFGL